MTDTAAKNTTAVIGQTVRKVKPCVLCGTAKGVTITYAVPLDHGGSDSEWNHHILCGKCRARRAEMHHSNMVWGAQGRRGPFPDPLNLRGW